MQDAHLWTIPNIEGLGAFSAKDRQKARNLRLTIWHIHQRKYTHAYMHTCGYMYAHTRTCMFVSVCVCVMSLFIYV